jgi:hypothetical protein
MRRVGLFSLAVLLIGGSAHHAAAQVVLSLGDGRATLRATNATTAEILSEWSRAGQTTMVNLDKVDKGRVTLTLDDVPERMALDVILRSAAGFVAIPRTIDEAGASRIARIVILPRSTPRDGSKPAMQVQPATVPAIPPSVAPSDDRVVVPAVEPVDVERLVGPDGEPIPDDQDGAEPSGPPTDTPDDAVNPAPADELRPDGAVVPAQPR